MFEFEQRAIENRIADFCKIKGLPMVALKWTSIPFSGEWGLSTSLFELAAAEARLDRNHNVPVRAGELALEIKSFLGNQEGFSHIEAVKGYLNLYFSTSQYAKKVINEVIMKSNDFGRAERNHKLVMVEFSQPNTHKAFHVGHLRSAILGDALARLLDFSGYDVIRANYPGDMGLHVIKWLWNYMKFHLGEKPSHDITRWMGDLYLEANKRLEENPELENEVRAVYARWDRREPQVVALWQKTRQWSLDGFSEMYDLLGIKFDKYYFNSQMEKPGKEMVEELIERKIAQDERPELN